MGDAVREGLRAEPAPSAVDGAARVAPLVSVDDAVVVEAVKLAEDGSGDVVVRLYEPQGARTTAGVTPHFETTGAREVDLLERPIDQGRMGRPTAHRQTVPDRHAAVRPVTPPGG